VLTEALAKGPWLLGDQFSAADVMLGSLLSIALINKRLPKEPVLTAYDARLTEREAYKRAVDATWPPNLFPPA
jgi:glutathione S-transferase